MKTFKNSVISFFLISLGLFSLSAQNSVSNQIIVKVGYYENEIFQEGAGPDKVKKGYAYEYYHKLSEYTGWQYEYVYGEFGDLYNKLVKGEIDFLAGVPYRQERAQYISYPEVAMGNTTYNLVKNHNIKSITKNPDSLNGKVIGVYESDIVQVLDKWLKKNKINAKVVKYQNYDSLLKSIDTGESEVLLVEGYGTRSRDDIDVIHCIGKKDYYLCVSKLRPDLLEILNKAQEKLLFDDQNYIADLNSKYFSKTVINTVLDDDEEEWIKNHSSIKVGYLNNYLPYCDTDKNGNLNGILKDLIPLMLSNLKLNSSVSYSTKAYISYSSMIEDLNSGILDVVFPVGGGLYYLEENGVYQSIPVAKTSVSLVFKDVFENKQNFIFAINKNNSMQEYYIKSNFPDAKTVYYDSIDECLKAIVDEKANFTTVNGLRVTGILRNSKYSSLNSVEWIQSDERGFGVRAGNEALLRLINRGLNTIDDQHIMNIGYEYANQLYNYSAQDFIKDYFWLIVLVFIVFVVMFVFFEHKGRRVIQTYLEKEKIKNQELLEVQDKQEYQLEQIKNLNLELEHAQSNMERYIADMMRYASSEDDADKILHQVVEYIGKNIGSDRVYVFEENQNHCYDNTYEWCKTGITAEIDNLQNLPYDGVMELWIDEFKLHNNVVITDLEEYKNVSQAIYDILKPQSINTLVAVPITINRNIIGFFGVDNPPKEKMLEIREFLNLVEFVFSMMIRLRNNARDLEENAIHDQLTGCKNRKALVWAYDLCSEESMAVVAFDLNGLKQINDNQGHEAGDHFICRIADSIGDVFGKDNVYRMGGDEFSVVLQGVTKENFEKLLENCMILLGTTASVGSVFVEKVEKDFAKIMKQADENMYKAKDKFYQDKRKKR